MTVAKATFHLVRGLHTWLLPTMHSPGSRSPWPERHVMARKLITYYLVTSNALGKVAWEWDMTDRNTQKLHLCILDVIIPSSSSYHY